MDVKIKFSQEELQLLYAACMSYGDKLSNISKDIPNEILLINGMVGMDGLTGRAKKSCDLAQRITEYMEE